jgi:hypothetical protein
MRRRAQQQTGAVARFEAPLASLVVRAVIDSVHRLMPTPPPPRHDGERYWDGWCLDIAFISP